MITRGVMFPSGREVLYQRNRYSPAIRSNGLLFVSRQEGSNEDGSSEPDLERQVRTTFTNLNAIFREAGCTFDDVINRFHRRPRNEVQAILKIVPEFWVTLRTRR